MLSGTHQVVRADPLSFEFTIFDVPDSTLTSASGINNSGQIVGTFGSSTGQHGFLDNHGTFTTIDPPGSTRTLADGINNSGSRLGDLLENFSANVTAGTGDQNHDILS